MTLIAVTLAGNYPLLLGDLLISRKTPVTEYEIALPIQDVRVVGDADYAITALAQKLCIIAPNLAVGWSGTMIAAKTIISDMKQRFAGGHSLTLDDVAKFFDDLDYPEVQDVQMVGMLLEEKNRVRSFGWNASTHDTPLFGNMRLAGRGSDHFLRVLQNASMPTTVGNVPDYATALGNVLIVACAVLGEEMYTTANLGSFYGGGARNCFPQQR